MSDSTHKLYKFSIGRFQLRLHIFVHHFPRSPDRWVVQPHFIYDRKKR